MCQKNMWNTTVTSSFLLLVWPGAPSTCSIRRDALCYVRSVLPVFTTGTAQFSRRVVLVVFAGAARHAFKPPEQGGTSFG